MPVDLFATLTRYLGELSAAEHEQAMALDEAGRGGVQIARIIHAQRMARRGN